MTPRKDYPGSFAEPVATAKGKCWKWTHKVRGRSVTRHFRGSWREVKQAARREAERLESSTPHVATAHRTDTVAALVDAFLRLEAVTLAPGTQRTYKATLGLVLRDTLGAVRAAMLSPAHITEYLGYRRASGVSARTLQKDRMTLSALFSWAVAEGRLSVSPVRPYRRGKAPRVTQLAPYLPTPSQEHSLQAHLDATDPDTGDYYFVGRRVGWRSESEGCRITWGDWDRDQRVLTIHATKTHQDRAVPLDEATMQRLRERFLRCQSRGPWMFTGVRGSRVRSFRRRLRMAAEAVGIPYGRDRRVMRDGQQAALGFTGKVYRGWTPYTARHARVTEWVATGQLEQARLAAGHARLATTQGYTHLSAEHVRLLADVPVTGRAAGR
jgi:integrase